MNIKKAFKTLFIVLIISVGINCSKTFSQDSLFVFPSAKNIDVTVNGTSSKLDGNLFYEYQLLSSENIDQSIDAFYIEIHSDVSQIMSPNMWLGSVSIARKQIVYWGSRGREYDIPPDKEKNGFGFFSDGIPSIVTYYSSGYIETPKVPEGEAPPLESIIGADIFENSVQGKTIGPRAIPENTTNEALADTLSSYVTQSCDLGWITNQGICRSLQANLDNVQRHLEQNRIQPAINNLRAFLNELEAVHEQHLSSEAYALLKFNGEYLFEKLQEE